VEGAGFRFQKLGLRVWKSRCGVEGVPAGEGAGQKEFSIYI